MLLLAPHLDDIPASATGVLLRAARPTALTVCAGWREGPLAWWDAQCGFASPEEAATVRRAEDREALAGLDVEIVHLDFVDGQYGRPAGDAERLEAELVERFRLFDRVVVPAGIGGHVDHLWVRDAAIRARADGQPLWLYGDYGYHVTHDWNESSGLARYGLLPGDFRSVALPPALVRRKQEMLDAYRSQLPGFRAGPDLLAPHLLAIEWYAQVPAEPSPVEPYPQPYRQLPSRGA